MCLAFFCIYLPDDRAAALTGQSDKYVHTSVVSRVQTVCVLRFSVFSLGAGRATRRRVSARGGAAGAEAGATAEAGGRPRGRGGGRGGGPPYRVWALASGARRRHHDGDDPHGGRRKTFR